MPESGLGEAGCRDKNAHRAAVNGVPCSFLGDEEPPSVGLLRWFATLTEGRSDDPDMGWGSRTGDGSPCGREST